MKKEINPAVMFGVIAAVLIVAGLVGYRVIAGNVSSSPSEMGQQLSSIMARTGGDTSKMTPEELKIYDKAVESGYYRPGGSSGRMSSTGQPMSSGYSGNTRGPGSGSSGSSGGYPGGSGGYPGSSGSSGSSGSYPR
jgi:hypothetical protein